MPGTAAAPGTELPIPCTTAPKHRDTPQELQPTPASPQLPLGICPLHGDYAQSWSANSSWDTLALLSVPEGPLPGSAPPLPCLSPLLGQPCPGGSFRSGD